ncbi:hypothetical protein [Streptomyces sp. NPDC049040]|uniref:hypothetical protein n=1 Tax=Streptomyces sp. NPDC049040 TaxID=3365593 RepID=UPI00371945CB
MSIETHDPHAPNTAVDSLLAELDPLSYPARMRALASWVRDRRGAGELRPMLDELDTRGAYGRRLAVVAAAVAGDTGFLEDRLADPDAAVRGHALKASLRLPIGDTALERAMDDAPAVVRRQITGAVVAGRRTALAERLLPAVRERWGDVEAARLLPGCGPDTVRLLLPGLHRSVDRRRALARRHPDALLDEIARQLADLPAQIRTGWWEVNADVFTDLADARPQRVLDLLEAHCPATLPPAVKRILGRLLKAEPARTIRLLTAPERAADNPVPLVSRTALSRLARLGTPEFTDLGRAWGHLPGSLTRLLRALPPARREAFHDTATAGSDLSRTDLGDAILEALPRHRARAEARRMAAQAADRGAPWGVVLAAVAHLPPDEARERLIAATRRPAADDRAVAYPLLVRNAARSGDAAAVARLLDDLLRLRNEQDPVRAPALAALACVPPRLFRGDDAGPLGRIATDASEARDCSGQTRQALSTLALAVLREHATGGEPPLIEWSLATITRLYGNTAGAWLGRLDTTLRRGQEFQVFEALRPWLEAGADKVDHSLTFALARAFGRRARHMPELQELLWQAVQFGDNATVSRAVGLWLDDPATRDERAERVIALEPSAVVLAPVLAVVTRRRTDLLDTVLSATPPYGRFLVQGARWLPPVDAAGSWLPRQQADAARLLARAAGDASEGKHTRAWHIRAAAAIPELGAGIVRRWTDSPDTVLAEAALGALVWTDRPADALPLLLAHAGDDRARVALYAATRAASRTPPSRLSAALRGALLPPADAAPGAGAAPAAKVTSRKELVRLAGALLPAREAVAVIAEAYGLPGQHPDVQAACVAMAVELSRSPAAWQLLERAAEGPPVTRTAVLRTRPYAVAEEERGRYAELVLRIADGDDTETADAALALLAGWSPWHPGAARLLRAKTVDLDNRTSWPAAAQGLVALTATPGGADTLLDALRLLVAADGSSAARELDAAAERDRPARRRLGHLVTRLSAAAARPGATGAKGAALLAAEYLCGAGDFVVQGVRLSVDALDLDADAEVLLPALDRLAALHDGRPALAVRTAEVVRQRLTAAGRPGHPPVLLAASERLAAAGDHAGGLLAVALTHAVGVRAGWPADTRRRLRGLRGHPQPDVREAAVAVATAPEWVFFGGASGGGPWPWRATDPPRGLGRLGGCPLALEGD